MWTESLKAGDNVIIDRPGFGYTVKKVDRVTKTLVVVGEQKYQKKTGCLVGDSGFYKLNILEATNERVEQACKTVLMWRIKKSINEGDALKNLSVESLRKIQGELL